MIAKCRDKHLIAIYLIVVIAARFQVLAADNYRSENNKGSAWRVYAANASGTEEKINDDEYYDDDDEEYEDEYEDKGLDIPDPLYYWNVGMYKVNDRLYFWVLKPIAKGYGKVVPERGRGCIKNFFVNLAMPIRLVNCLLQGKFRPAGTELAAFTINTTMGVIGFGNPAKTRFQLKHAFEDLGQTLGSYGIGNGFYLVIPLFGPSSFRDTLGFVGDGFLTPVNYLPFLGRLGVRSFQTINETSLKIGEYEQLLKSAISPYESLRNVYVQYRIAQIKK